MSARGGLLPPRESALAAALRSHPCGAVSSARAFSSIAAFHFTGLRPWRAGSDRKLSRNGAWRPERPAGDRQLRAALAHENVPWRAAPRVLFVSLGLASVAVPGG